MIDIYDEIKGVTVTGYEREITPTPDGEDENIWDYYTLADGRRCVYRNGFFWEWLES